MAKAEDFKLHRIETVVLRVDIHCDGCRREVKKLLHKVEGVYTVCIDADQHKVTVSGNVDPESLIRKLTRSGKYAAIWCCQRKTIQNNQQQQQLQKQKNALNKDATNKCQKQQKQELLKAIQILKNQKDISCNEEDSSWIDEDGDFDDLNLLANRIKQNNLLRNQNPSNVKNNSNVGCDGGNGNKAIEEKKCPEQRSSGMHGQQPQQKPNSNYQTYHGGLNQQGMSPFLMNMMDMQMMMNNNNNNSSQNHNNVMMYQRAPQASPFTGYQHSYHFNGPYYHNNPSLYVGDHLFSDESTHACSIM